MFPNPRKNRSQPGAASCRPWLRCGPGTASCAFYTFKTIEYSQQTTASCHQWFRSVVLRPPSRALQQCVCSDALPQSREMSISAHPKKSHSWGLMDHTGVLKLDPVGSLDPTQGFQVELLSPESLLRAVFPCSPSPEVDAAAQSSALGTGVLDVQTQLDGRFGKTSSFY